MKTKIFIDFDGTIFDTDSFKALIWSTLAKSGFSYSNIEKAYEIACSDYRYSPVKQLDLLSEMELGDRATAHYLLQRLYHQAKDMIFEDAIQFLRAVDREKFGLYLLSMGDKDFQRVKIVSSSISHYFDNVYLTDEQKWLYLDELVGQSDPFIFIDDRGDSVQNVAKKFANSLAIEINRIGQQSDPMEPTVEFGNIAISNFTQLGELIDRFEIHSK
ncbi:MAG: HAD family hydrolase [Patescibacteria group bacterium]|jgi:hypothetical protein